MSFLATLNGVAMCAHGLKGAVPKAPSLADWNNVITNTCKSIANNASRIVGHEHITQPAPTPSIIALLFMLTPLM